MSQSEAGQVTIGAWTSGRTVDVAPYARIVGMQWDNLGTSELQRQAVVSVSDKGASSTKLAPPGTVMDSKMGVVDPRLVVCDTCWQGLACPGHEGEIQTVPFYNQLYFNYLHKLLWCICPHCCGFAMDRRDERLVQLDRECPPGPGNGLDRFNVITGLCNPKVKPQFCARCDMPLPKWSVVKTRNLQIDTTWHEESLAYVARLAAPPGSGRGAEGAQRQQQAKTLLHRMRQKFNAVYARDILRGLALRNTDDLAYVGINQQNVEAWVPNRIPVLPPNFRPTIVTVSMGAERKRDDLTMRYQDLVAAVQGVWESLAVFKGSKGALTQTAIQLNKTGTAPAVKKALAAASAEDRQHALFAAPGFTEKRPVTAEELNAWLHVPDEPLHMDKYVTMMKKYAVLVNAGNKTFKEVGRGLADVRGKLEGKTGGIRKSLEAHRPDFTGRAPLSPDCFIHMEEFVIPEHMAVKFTVPEPVTVWNRARLALAVSKGPGVLGGAVTLSTADGDRLSLDCLTQEDRDGLDLRIGYVIERHLVPGDVVVKNRTPSLHKGSIQAGYIRIGRDKTVKMDHSRMPPFNADCDGDEITVLVPQSTMGQAEARYLMTAAPNFITPTFNAPMMGLIQDNILGAGRLCAKGTFLTPDDMSRLANTMVANEAWSDFDPTNFSAASAAAKAPLPPSLPEPAILLPKKRAAELNLPRALYTGKQALSMAVQGTGLNLTIGLRNERNLCEDNVIVFRDGHLVAGIAGKKAFGKGGAMSAIHAVIAMRGPHAATDMLMRVRNVTRAFNVASIPQTVRLEDVTLSEEARARVAHVKEVTRAFTEGLAQAGLKLGLGRQEIQEGQEEVTAAMDNAITKIVTWDVRRRHKLGGACDNSMMNMVGFGARGSVGHLRQVMGTAGQQKKEGQRVDATITGTRLAPCFHHHDISPEAGGCSFGAFQKGLATHELLIHAIASRLGVVYKCISVSIIGYLTRKMNKTMEEALTCERMVLASGYAVQGCYGNDGFDASKVIRLNPWFLLQPDTAFLQNLGFSAEERLAMERAEPGCLGAVRESLVTLVKWRRLVQRHSIPFAALPQVVTLPWSTDLIWADILPKHVRLADAELWRQEVAGRDPERMRAERLATARAEVIDLSMNHFLPWIRRYTPHISALRCMLYFLCSLGRAVSQCPCPASFRRARLHQFYTRVQEAIEDALIPSGEAVGIITVQCISEPTTQMMLNTFHMAGKGNNSVADGASRMKEVMWNSASKLPSMRVAMKPGARTGPLLTGLIGTPLRDIVRQVYVTRDPVMEELPFTGKEKDAHLCTAVGLLSGSESETMTRSCAASAAACGSDPVAYESNDCIIRFTLDKALMKARHLTPSSAARYIGQFVSSHDGVGVSIVHSAPKDASWVVRVRPWAQMTEDGIPVLLTAALRKYETMVSKAAAKSAAAEDTQGAYALLTAYEAEGQGPEAEAEKAWELEAGRSAVTQVSDPRSYSWAERLKESLLASVCIGGVAGITGGDLDTAEDAAIGANGSLLTEKRPVIEAIGSNLAGVAKLSGADALRTRSRDLMDVSAVLGLTAARVCAARELYDVFAASGSVIDDRHLNMTIDIVTVRGEWLRANKASMASTNMSTIKLSSFEQQLQVLQQNAAFGAQDKILGLTEAVMLGVRPPVGTSAFSILPMTSDGTQPARSSRKYGHAVTGPALRRWKAWAQREAGSGSGSGAGEGVTLGKRSLSVLPHHDYPADKWKRAAFVPGSSYKDVLPDVALPVLGSGFLEPSHAPAEAAAEVKTLQAVDIRAAALSVPPPLLPPLP